MKMIDPEDLISYRFKNDISYNSFVSLIKRMPTIDAEPVRHGRWYLEHHTWFCDQCGKNPTKGMGYVQGTDELYSYCPNCGAKMND